MVSLESQNGWKLCLVFFGLFISFRLGGGLKNWELSHGSWWQGMNTSWLQSQNAELSSLLASSSVVLASQKCLQSQGSGGFLVAKLRTVVAFGFAGCPLTGTAESWSRNAELSSRLASLMVFVSQKMSTIKGIRGAVARNAEVSTVTRIQGVLCLVWMFQKGSTCFRCFACFLDDFFFRVLWLQGLKLLGL